MALHSLKTSEFQQLAEIFNINSVQVSREYHEARKAQEFTINFRDSSNSKHRIDLWVNDSDISRQESPEEYVKTLVFEAVRKELENEQQ